MKIALLLLSQALLLLFAGTGRRQAHPPVRWEYRSVTTSDEEADIIITAHLDPGWHIYSQFIGEGGPLPTSFSLDPTDAFICSGKIRETGKPVRFYDDTYDLEVTWYEQEVSFSQKIILKKKVFTVGGKITYMTCNDFTCVPGQQKFSIDVTAVKKMP
jgi:DsbC/DsbD-like thiol-disulfide interchange protein